MFQVLSIDRPKGFNLNYQFRVSTSGSKSLNIFPQCLLLYRNRGLCLELLDCPWAVKTMQMRINEVILLCLAIQLLNLLWSSVLGVFGALLWVLILEYSFINPLQWNIVLKGMLMCINLLCYQIAVSIHPFSLPGFKFLMWQGCPT